MKGIVYHIPDPTNPGIEHGYIGVVKETKGVYRRFTEHSKRTKEHMAQPDKREKCLGAMHKKKQCPHCGYINNAGNIAIHIRKYHVDI